MLRRGVQRLVPQCPFCGSVVTAHCWHKPDSGASRNVCDLRLCVNTECKAYGPALDSTKWVVPPHGTR